MAESKDYVVLAQVYRTSTGVKCFLLYANKDGESPWEYVATFPGLPQAKLGCHKTIEEKLGLAAD